MFAFDWTLNLGTAMQFVIALVVAVRILTAVRLEVKSLNSRMASVEGELKKQGDILITLARQDERMIAIEGRVTRLEPKSP